MTHTEIERKFLVAGPGWKQPGKGERVRQAYLSTDKQRVVRVRVIEDDAWLTIKGQSEGITRLEFEYPIPLADAEVMLDTLCYQPFIDKTRYRIEHGNHVWEVDEFNGDNHGLVVAEIELEAEDEAFERPEWLGEEVSDDPRYFNSNLIDHPYREWSRQA
ncbi:CYTH domain-containing protein [Wenzhouxiangella sp. AB-CW3]|uniref:CYTH domain-containing protein n=1 Tax=Wenzhouxiangella sp. AB-CW3 TaxID=2771012 RepID=UPI00168AF764|nr:CYTH domain-containing protein [Wenzhouxiangella sp. AB-CW3]QOC22620.1 CYTH domain-containing protein [Wenzhouxiangella sp. AB-CW3]